MNKFDLVVIMFLSILILFVLMNNFGINFESTVNIIDVLSLMTTIFIAVYVGLHLQKKENIVSRNREILLSYIEQVENKIIIYKNEACSENFNLISINSNNKSVNNLIGNIPKLLHKIKPSESFNEIDVFKKQTKDLHLLLTFYKEEDVLDNIYLIENNIVTINRDRRSQVESIFSELLFNIVCFKINLSKM